jgi:uncharacterized protein YjbJ (UPF0337 family)
MITTQMTKDNWNLTKNKLKQKWPALTDADLQCSEGGHDALVGRIEQRTHQDRDAIELAIKDCAPEGACATTTSAATAPTVRATAATDKPAAQPENQKHWVATSAKLKQKWPALTDDDLKFVEGGREALLGRIEKRTGETRDTVEKVVKECSGGTCCSTTSAPVAPTAKPGVNFPTASVTPVQPQPATTGRAA